MTVNNTGRRTKDVKLTNGKYSTLPINDDGHVSLMTGLGKGDSIMATAQLSARGLPKGAELQGRFYYADYRKGQKTKRAYTFPAQEIVGTNGGSFGMATQLDHVTSSPATGWSRRLRFEVIAYVDGVSIADATYKTAK